MKTLRQSTLDTMDLGNVLDIFKNGTLPAKTEDLVDEVFGDASNRGAFVISGANGIVGAGKTMQIGSRLLPYNVPIVALDFPGAQDGIGMQYKGLEGSFGPENAMEIMSHVIRMHYDGNRLPSKLKSLNPKFLLEAIPEILEVKKKHYGVFRETFPSVEIRSVTSGFPSSELGVGIAHPAFPHQINKIWEIVEDKPSAATKLFWSLGMIPLEVGDHWSFILDVLFCGITHAALQYHHAANMPVWKIDKYIRRQFGPNPFRAHDAIGAKGANFLTWSCLHHLSEKYGGLFTPTDELTYRKDSGQNWYPLNHFRPLVNWTLTDIEEEEMKTWILGPLVQMTSLMLHEKRGHLSHINAIGEICAQFRSGILAMMRQIGADESIARVEAYHKLNPSSACECWYPDVLSKIEEPEWQQLYVNAEHDGTVGVITINRESYNSDVDAELNRAIEWLKAESIERVILSGDFHLATQLVGADTSDFYPALQDEESGYKISYNWSRTARRLNDDFKVSVGFISGKRCLGGMLELMMHCHYLVATDSAQVGMPEVTLPVIPGMEGCHWPFRKAHSADWPKLFELLMTGRAVGSEEAVGWLVDYSGSLEECLATAWKIASGGDHAISQRTLDSKALDAMTTDFSLPDSGNRVFEESRKAIMQCVVGACKVSLDEAVTIQARHSAKFMNGDLCRFGVIGADAKKVLTV